MSLASVLLKVSHLKKFFSLRSGSFGTRKRYVYAVNGVSFELNQGETLGIVGESGCGKSTLGRSILRLVEPTGGEVEFDGRNVLTMPPRQLREIRKEMQIVFQDPYASLNPRYRVGRTLMEPMAVHRLGGSREREKRAELLLERVGLSSGYLNRYPHEFSGGQRQRVGIARALAVNPKLVVLDEPVAALDVSVQAQVLNLLEDLQTEYQLTYLFIAHDLSVVRHISNRVLVLYLGKMVELSKTEDLFIAPIHPYTKALLSAVPLVDPDAERERIILQGDLPSPTNPPKGCVFHTRCPLAMDVCTQIEPEWREVDKEHFVACHLS